MRAITSDWKNWYNNRIDVEVDIDMALAILEQLDTAIDVAVSEKDYLKAKVLIQDRTSLNDKIEVYNAERNTEEDA